MVDFVINRSPHADCDLEALPESDGEARPGKILKRGDQGLSAPSGIPRGKVVRGGDFGGAQGVSGVPECPVAGGLPERTGTERASNSWRRVAQGVVGCVVVCFVLLAAVAFLPAGFQSATAYVVSGHERLLSSVALIAEDYGRLRREPEPEGFSDIAVDSGAPQDVSPRKVMNGGAAGNARALHSSRTVDHVISPLALVNKVQRIIKEHSPRHRSARELAEAIIAESAEQKFDPLFVAAVIKSESTFNAMARSHVGAQGLMQIMPQTGAWLAAHEEIPRGRLTDIGYNLKLGIRYLKYLDNLYGGNRMFSLIAYNWGPGRVESAADGKRRVPPEVTTYALKILKDYRKWRGDVYSN